MTTMPLLADLATLGERLGLGHLKTRLDQYILTKFCFNRLCHISAYDIESIPAVTK